MRWLCFQAQSAGFAGPRLLCLQKVLSCGGQFLVKTVAAVVGEAAIMDSRPPSTHLWLAAQQSAVGDRARWVHQPAESGEHPQICSAKQTVVQSTQLKSANRTFDRQPQNSAQHAYAGDVASSCAVVTLLSTDLYIGEPNVASTYCSPAAESQTSQVTHWEGGDAPATKPPSAFLHSTLRRTGGICKGCCDQCAALKLVEKSLIC